MNDDANAAVECVSSPSSAAELSAGEEETTEEVIEEREEPAKDDGEEEEGEEGEILSDSDEEGDQDAVTTKTTNETASKSKSDDNSHSKKGSSQDYGNRDGRRSPSPRDGYQYRRRYRYSDHSQSPSSRNTSSSGNTSNSNHTARRGVKRPASNDRRAGMDVRNRKEGSPFTKRKPKMKAPPPSNSPFWGERKHLLPTPSVSPRTGYNLDSDYPQLPRRLVKEYFPDPPIRFVRDSHNFPAADHNKSDNSKSSTNRSTDKNKDNASLSPPATTSNEEEVEDMASQECEVTVPSLPSMQDLVKNQMFADSSSEMEVLPPLIEDKSLETSNTLADVFSEDFPLLDGEMPEQEATSLKKLVAGGSGSVDITIAVGEHKVLLLSCVKSEVSLC